MTAVITSHKKVSGGIIAIVIALATVLCASMLPLEAVTGGNAPSIASINKSRSLNLDGDDFLPVMQGVLSASTQGPFATPVAAMLSSAQSSAQKVLAAPTSATANSVQLAGCSWMGLGCLAHLLKDTAIAAVTCNAAMVSSLIGLSFGAHMCMQTLNDFRKELLTIAMWAITPSEKKMAATIMEGMQKAALSWANWVLVDMLSGRNTLTEPTLSCQQAGEAVKANNCKDSFFLGQYNIMRHVSMFMLLPLFMLVVIQSVLKGSLYTLTRAAFVMLPVAIIGMVAAVFLAQLMLNISDSFVMMIGTYTTSTTKYSTQFTATVSGMNTGGVNWYALIWMFILLFATIIIYLELLLRQVGVYMASMFLPLAFAALVWPSIAGFTKKMLELLLGLIFSKVFIAAALSLGIEAFASSSTGGGSALPGGMDNATSAGLTALVSGSLVFCMAAFTGTKVMAMTPAAMSAAEGRVANLGGFWARGQLTNAVLARTANQQERRNRNRGTGRIAQTYRRLTGSGFSNQGRGAAAAPPSGPGAPAPVSPAHTPRTPSPPPGSTTGRPSHHRRRRP